MSTPPAPASRIRARPVWRRCLLRYQGFLPGPPTPDEIHDAILVLRQGVELPPDALDIEALRILDGCYEWAS